MMASDGYRTITVDLPDEDEEVIYVGAPAESDAPSTDAARADDALADAPSADEADSPQAARDAAAPSTDGEGAQLKRRSAVQEELEQTLEDLNADEVPQSRMRIAVLVAVAVLVVVFCVYWFGLR